MLPAQVVFLELVIDPACSIVFESEREERDVMSRPPRQKNEGLFTRRILVISLVQGFVVLGTVLGVYIYGMARGFSENDVRTMTFATIVVANLFLILTNRSWHDTFVTALRTPNKAMWYVFAGTIFCLGLVLYVPVLQSLFGFAPVPASAILLCAAAGAGSVIWFEVFKFWNSRGSDK